MSNVDISVILAVVGAMVLLLLLFLLVRPKQKVRLSESDIRRPHMVSSDPVERSTLGIVTTERGKIGVHAKDATHSGPADDLTILKGVGPKLAGLLAAQGLTRFDQVASLSPGQLSALDESLGAFRGRLERDRVVEQADFLARGDRDGFEQKFGKL